MFVAIVSVPIIMLVLLAGASGLSAISAQRSAVRALARILFTTSALLALACIAFVWWFYTSFELTW